MCGSGDPILGLLGLLKEKKKKKCTGEPITLTGENRPWQCCDPGTHWVLLTLTKAIQRCITHGNCICGYGDPKEGGRVLLGFLRANHPNETFFPLVALRN